MDNLNKQQITTQLTFQLSALYPNGLNCFKSKEQFDAYLDQMLVGLEENKLFTERFIKLGLKILRARKSAFYPSVGEFVDACMPKLSDYDMPQPYDAYISACKVSGGGFRHSLTPLANMAGKDHWQELYEGRGCKSFIDRYNKLFKKFYLGEIELEYPETLAQLMAPKKEKLTEDQLKENSEIGRAALKKLMSTLEVKGDE